MKIIKRDGKEEQFAPQKIRNAIAKAFAEKEFEKFRVLQDRTYQSDFDRLVAETSDDLTE